MKLSEARVPGIGTMNVLSPASWFSLILGVIMILVTVAVGQNLKTKIGARLPFDTDIDPFVKMQAPASLASSKRVY